MGEGVGAISNTWNFYKILYMPGGGGVILSTWIFYKNMWMWGGEDSLVPESLRKVCAYEEGNGAIPSAWIF